MAHHTAEDTIIFHEDVTTHYFLAFKGTGLPLTVAYPYLKNLKTILGLCF